VTGQIGTTPDKPANPAYRVLYVIVALLLGLFQIGAGIVGAMALAS
jgi:hypothetical protein